MENGDGCHKETSCIAILNKQLHLNNRRVEQILCGEVGTRIRRENVMGV
jgi:hypothetical protein